MNLKEKSASADGLQINENKKIIKSYNQAFCCEVVKMKYVIILNK